MEITKKIKLEEMFVSSEYFRKLRMFHNFNVSEVAKAINVTRGTINQIEIDLHRVKFGTVYKLNEFYKNLNDGNK